MSAALEHSLALLTHFHPPTFFDEQHGHSPSSGKPLWITLDDAETQHIFFDDNIHNDPHDSIVAVRARRSKGAQFEALSGEETLGLHGTFPNPSPPPLNTHL